MPPVPFPDIPDAWASKTLSAAQSPGEAKPEFLLEERTLRYQAEPVLPFPALCTEAAPPPHTHFINRAQSLHGPWHTDSR